MRRSIPCLVLVILASALVCSPTTAPTAPAPKDAFLVGADVSWAPQQEAEGRRFTADGRERDILAILKDHGFNAIRLRLFVDPTATGGYSPKGHCGKESTLAMARRVKDAGLQLLLDLHYSDTWADPAHQTKPAAWRDLDPEGLKRAVRLYTRDTLAEFARRGLAPDIVQVGNEINRGLLWPDGKTDDLDGLAALLRAGIAGVREAVPSAQVMLHIALGGQNEASRWFLDNVLRRGVEFDLIGQSYYPRWHGTLDDLNDNLTDLAHRYAQGIIVVEYSDPQGREVTDIVRSLPAGKGRGSFIWEPTHPDHGRLFSGEGVALPALKEYRRIADGAFSPSERLLSTYFFWRGPWDDTVVTSGGKLGMSGTWKAIYPPPDDPRASIFGLDSPSRWPGGAIPDTQAWPATYKDGHLLQPWLMAEWRAMKWSGVDFVLLDDWHSLCFKPDLSPQPCFEALAHAWLELDRRGESPIPFAMFLETPFAWHGADHKDRDATQASADGIVELWEPTRAFLRQFYGEKNYKPILPVRALARILIGGEARPVVHFWFPTWEGAGLRKWDAWTFQELRRMCRDVFGVEPFVGVSQHVHGPEFLGGWSSNQPGGGREDISSGTGLVDYDVAWWGGMAGPQIQRDAIALGPGHWCPRQSGQKPVTLHWSSAYTPDSTRYEYCWRRVLTQPESFRRKILIVESWNNNDEGCAISYSEPKDFRDESGELIDRWGDCPELYMELTREFSSAWKEGRCPERFCPKR